MQENGNPTQCVESYPSHDMLMNDIVKECSYVCIDDDGKTIIAVFYYAKEIDETYNKIYEGSWLNNEPYGVVHRLTAPTGKKGVAGFCLEWCFAKSGGNLKVDTHRNNATMHHMLKKKGFVRCGIIYLMDGAERIAYQKIEQRQKF